MSAKGVCKKCGNPMNFHYKHNNGIVTVFYCDKPGSKKFDRNDCRKFESQPPNGQETCPICGGYWNEGDGTCKSSFHNHAPLGPSPKADVLEVPTIYKGGQLPTEAYQAGYAAGLSARQAQVDKLVKALNLVIPRCVKCFDWATKFYPKNLWPLCTQHASEIGVIQVVDYHNAILAREALAEVERVK